MKFLKLVGAKSYVGPRSNNMPVLKNEVVSMKDEDAEAVLKEVSVDALNNEHPLFEEVDGPEDAGSVQPVVAVKAKAKRTARASA